MTYQQIGIWSAAPVTSTLQLSSLSELRVWIGLKNTDDQGTYFDLRAEVAKNGVPIASGETKNIQGVVRNPSLATEVTVSLGAIASGQFSSGDVLSIRILTKIAGSGGHNSAAGLRMYYDAVSRPSRFGATFGAPPTKLVVTAVNSGANPSAGVAFSVIVQSQTAGGALANVAGATGISLMLKTGAGALGGTLTGALNAGTNQVTITGVIYTKAESGVVITATRTSGDILTAGDSAPFTVDPGAATVLAFSPQPGNATAGCAIPGPPTVVVRDSFGNTVTSSTIYITVALGTNPGGSTLGGNTTIYTSLGVATFNDLSLNKVGTGYTLTASAAGLTPATSSAFNVNAGAAAALAFTTQPVNSTAGSAIGGPPTVTVRDSLGNTATLSTASITIAIGSNPSGSALGGTTTRNAVSGVVSFSDLSINEGGNGYTLTASSAGLAGVTSDSFNITSGAGGGTVAGLITRVSNGTAISGALVEAIQGSTVVASATTNSSGNYSITALTTGTYRVKASFRGLVPQVLNNVAVTTGDTTTVNLSLNFGIAVQSPVAGATVNDFSVLVTGFFDTSLASEVGIQVNGYVALIDSDEFAASVPVDSQTTTVTATLSDVAGNLL